MLTRKQVSSQVNIAAGQEDDFIDPKGALPIISQRTLCIIVDTYHRRIMTAWLQTWSDTEDKPKGCKWFGQTICPRELHIKDGRIVQTPVRELDAVHGKRTFHENVTVQGETSLEGIQGRVADLTVTVQPGEYRSFTLKLAADADHHTSLTYDPYTSELTLDRSYAGSRADIVHRRSCKVRSQNGALKLRILLDKNSVEVFVNDGEQTMIYD